MSDILEIIKTRRSVRKYKSDKVPADIIDKIVEPYFGENMYILIDEETKKCAVVDPGGASDKILTYLKKNSLELEYILLTHGHGDHIGAVNYIKSKTNATIVAHSDEKT